MSRKARLSHFRFYPSDFFNDPNVIVMDAEARGVYIGLLCAAWELEKPGILPGNDSALMRLARATPEEWARAKHPVSRCFDTSDGRWIQRRMVSEYEAQDRAVERYREAGSRAGRASAKARAEHKEQQELSNGPLNDRLTGSPGSPGLGKEEPILLASPPARPRSSSSFDEHPYFAAFYAEYPRHTKRRTAAQAFNRALKRYAGDIDPEDLVAAAKNYAIGIRQEGTEKTFVPYPASWLNSDQFLEEFEDAPSPKPSSSAD